MGKKPQTDGVKTLASVMHNRYGKSVVACESASGILSKQEVYCAGPEGWHPDKDDVVTFFKEGDVTFVEPEGWETWVPLNKKIEMAMARRDLDIRKEILDNTFVFPEPEPEQPKKKTKKAKADSSDEE